jgi:hypothetical protein
MKLLLYNRLCKWSGSTRYGLPAEAHQKRALSFTRSSARLQSSALRFR